MLLPLLLEQAKTSEAVSAQSGSEQINSPTDKQQKSPLFPSNLIQSFRPFFFFLAGLDIKLRVMSVTIGMLVIIIMVVVEVKMMMMMIARVAAEKGDADGDKDKLFTDAILHKLMADAAQTSWGGSV